MASQKRLIKELEMVREKFDAEPENDNLYHWRVVIVGLPNTPYDGGSFLIDIVFPPDYPFKHPTITFMTKIMHPNVNKHGAICLSVLDEWAPNYTMLNVLLAIVSFLREPNYDNPLMPELSQLYKSNPKQYFTTVAAYTRQHAT